MAPEEVPRRKLPRARINAAHFGMGVLFLTWLGFQIVLGRDQAPQVLDLLLGSIGGIWFGMVVRDQGQRDAAAAADAKPRKLAGDQPAVGGDDSG